MAGNVADGAASSTNRLQEGRRPDGAIAEHRPDATASLRKARSQLERVCQMLLWPSPEVLDSCGNLLASATAELEANRPAWQTASGGRLAAEEAQLTRRVVKHTQRLLENAANFHARWQRIRATLSGGYQADGAPSQMRCAVRRISVEG